MDIVIRPLGDVAEAQACARMMAETDPWLTLGRSFDDSLKTIEAPDKEVSVVLLDSQLAGFVILNMKGPSAGMSRRSASRRRTDPRE